MRTKKDRLRHTILFEILGLATSIPIAVWILKRPVETIGVMSVVIAIMAMTCNYVFNLGFDHALLKMGRPLNVRPPWMRAMHAIMFEAFLLLFTLPFVAWWLDVSVIHAFIIDIAFVVYYLFYAYAFNWTYDVVFPIPVAEEAEPVKL